MISKNKLKYIRSLKEKKFRQQYNVFVAEGTKLVSELLPVFECELLVATTHFFESTTKYQSINETIEVTDTELSQASFQKNPQQVLAIFKQPQFTNLKLENKLILALDGIQDPGNLGTIIRIADWYGISTVLCSTDCADIFNPKTVQATMGAIARVKIQYVDLYSLLKKNSHIPIYGTLLNGENIYHQELTENGIIVMGSEGNGISPEIVSLVSHRLFLPNYPIEEKRSESLNVAVATAITCAEFRRRVIK